jgi:hypothetical protein
MGKGLYKAVRKRMKREEAIPKLREKFSSPAAAAGPPDKVFLIGPVNEVKKGEAIIRGHFISRPRHFREGKDQIVRPEDGDPAEAH